MAILKNVELWWAKVDPKSPVKNQDADKPDYWDVQLRTTDKTYASAMIKENIKFKPLKRIVKDDSGNPVEDELGEKLREVVKDENGKPYFFVNLRKKVTKADGSAQQPVQLVAGDLSPINPKEMGNGTIGNVRVFQYEYTYQGKKGIANMLMAIQVTKLIKYEPKAAEDSFEITDMEVVKIGDNQSVDSVDLDDDINF